MSAPFDCLEFANLCHNLTILGQQYELSKRAMIAIIHVSSWTLNTIESGQIPLGMTPEPILHAAAYFHMRPVICCGYEKSS